MTTRTARLARSGGALIVLAALLSPASPAHALALQREPADTAEAEDRDREGLPLEPGRTLRFTTTEGSWLSLDVSPDGETMVFDLLGDLYLLPIEGGEARRLTSGMAFDAEPRFSPDGSRIVFISDRSGTENLWITSVDGTDTVQVTKGDSHRYQSPEWTPDGDYVVASRVTGMLGGTLKLWMFHVEGGSGIQLIEEPENLKTVGAAFGADPRYLWFTQRNGDWNYNAQLPQYQLSVYDRETGESYSRSSRWGSGFRPTLSPDGRWLVYGTRHEDQTGLRIRDLESGEERWLAYPVQHDAQESRATRGVLPGMSFTPDSRAVVASYGGEIWRIPVDGAAGAPERIPMTVDVALDLGPAVDFDYPIEDSPTFDARQIRDLAVSPDGERLAFTALDRLYVMDLPAVAREDGQVARRSAPDPERLAPMDAAQYQPTWSPDGESIAFGAWTPEGGDLFRVRADGDDDPVRINTMSALYRQPAWSPDGERIVAVRVPAEVFRSDGRSFGTDLVWLPADGGAATRIAPTEGFGSPHFGPEADRIYVYGRDGLVSMRWDGTDRKTHLEVTGKRAPGDDDPQRASLVMISPDGERALAAVNRQLYAVTVPPFAAGEAPTISVANPERAAVPARRLTEIGGEFPAWGPDGRTVHWALGNAHFTYDIDAAVAAEAETRADTDTDGDTDEGEGDDDEPAYSPAERRIRIAVTRDIPRGTAVLRGARIITMRGADREEVIERGDVVIRNNRIAAVGPTGSLDVPADAEVIDVAGTTIVPGYVDTHAHLRPARNTHRRQVWAYQANLAYGVTTTRDPQTGTTDVLTYADRVRAGEVIGPRIYSTGPGVFFDEQIEDLDQARNVLKRYSDYFDTKTLKMYISGFRDQRQWIIMAARELGIMPTTEGAIDFELNLTQIIDGYPGHEHSFPIFPLHRDVTELVARSGTAYTPTLLVSYGGPFAENYFYSRENPHDDAKLRRFTPHEEIDSKTRRRPGWFMDEEHVFEEHARFVTDLVEAGGRAGVGSHGQLQGLGYHWELWSVASGGLDEHDALKVATIHGADAIGLDGDIGTIDAGRIADLVVLERNPLEDIRNTNAIRYVVKNGRVYAADTLDEVWPRQRTLPRQWWWGRDPATTATTAATSEGR